MEASRSKGLREGFLVLLVLAALFALAWLLGEYGMQIPDVAPYG